MIYMMLRGARSQTRRNHLRLGRPLPSARNASRRLSPGLSTVPARHINGSTAPQREAFKIPYTSTPSWRFRASQTIPSIPARAVLTRLYCLRSLPWSMNLLITSLNNPSRRWNIPPCCTSAWHSYLSNAAISFMVLRRSLSLLRPIVEFCAVLVAIALKPYRSLAAYTGGDAIVGSASVGDQMQTCLHTWPWHKSGYPDADKEGVTELEVTFEINRVRKAILATAIPRSGCMSTFQSRCPPHICPAPRSPGRRGFQSVRQGKDDREDRHRPDHSFHFIECDQFGLYCILITARYFRAKPTAISGITTINIRPNAVSISGERCSSPICPLGSSSAELLCH